MEDNPKPITTSSSSVPEDTSSLSTTPSTSRENVDNNDNKQQNTEDIEMKDLDKSEYIKLPDTLATGERTRTTSDSSVSDANSYLRPSIDFNGRVSYLQDLEDLPQGRHLGLFSTIVLFVSRILGSGIFSITSGIYQDCGQSIFLFFSAWLVAGIASFGGLYVFLEMGSLVPRSGGAKVFLEFIYPYPKLLATVAFLVYSVLFGFTISNVLVFGEYVIHACGFEPSDFKTRTVGLVFLYFAAVLHGVSVSHGVRIQNVLGGLKLVLVGIIVVAGLYVTVFPESITGIKHEVEWDRFFEIRAQTSVLKFASAIIKASFAFSGWNSVHTVSNEIKDPVRTFKIAGPVSLIIMAITYLIANLAYLTVIPNDELANGSTLAGAILFTKIFGNFVGQKLLTLAVALSSAGNIFVVIYTISRVDQEVFREGYLPFSKFMSSNWPRGAPFRTLILSCGLTTAIIVLFPHGDIYSYMVSLEGYPQQLAIALIAVGIFIVRKRYPELNAPIRAGYAGTIAVFVISVYLLIGPFVSSQSPNPKGLENWPNYGLVAVFCILGCIAFWYVKFRLLPRIGGYELVSEEEKLSDGLTIKQWKKIYTYTAL
ncbi:Low-affinity methionine permease [Candida viswanathii]|uniref:Low-affinity methionine permease n=1 Tax=Candida viswanathii TaxID=5486 RepID=A0A367XWI9_9ASCO|nr:Low-affinity methionine permease [Candida viswanathii]